MRVHACLQDFYKDWWNAPNLGDYWRMWNMPVHKWMLRTVYYPALNFGSGRNSAMLLVFFVSAVLHEVAVSLPLKLANIFPWSFAGILAQVRGEFSCRMHSCLRLRAENLVVTWCLSAVILFRPFLTAVQFVDQVPMILVSQLIQKKYGRRWGNVFFWVSFCVVGQPICIISYYYDFIQRTSGSS